MSKLRMDRERPIAQTVRPIRAALVAGTGFPVCPNCEGGSPFPGEDSAAAAAGTFAVSTAGDKKGRHLRFLPSLNTRFPCWDSLGADGRLRKQEKDAAVGLPQRVFLRLFAVHRQRTATHAGYSTQSAAYPCRANPWHVVTHGTCEDKLHRTPNP